MGKSRTEYSAKNTAAAVIGRMLMILAGFCTRVVFTHTLRQEYVGINVLFSDILSVLALSELGAETAITYALYRPVAEGDVEKQKSLMRMFRHFYWVVACVVLAGGLLAFLYSFDEVALSSLLSTPKFVTLPIRIMNYMELTFDPTLAAISTLLILASLALIVLMEKLVGLDMFVK